MDKRMTPAAIIAMLKDDVSNAAIAMTPGGIEAQEAAGQQQFVNSTMLPKDCPRAELEALGVVFGEEVDDLFIRATLPAGWKKQATNHSMWSELLDDQFRKRGAIFFKAAFYDRSAHMHLNRCINVTQRYSDGNNLVHVAVTRGDEELFATESVERNLEDRGYFSQIDADEERAEAWVNEHYPDWRNVLAYW